MCLNNKSEERYSRSDDAMLFRLQYTVDKLIFANARIEMFTISRELNHRKPFFRHKPALYTRKYMYKPLSYQLSVGTLKTGRIFLVFLNKIKNVFGCI